MQPKLGARVRLLASGDTNKNDPSDARSVAIAALRSGACRPVRPDDHATVLKVRAKRHRDLGRTRTQVVCRLHARRDLADGFLDDLRRIDAQMREVRKRLTAAVRASGTTLTEIFGVGPVIAAVVIGETGDTDRFTGRDRFAACNGTAPAGVSSGHRKVHRLSRRGNRRLNHAVHMAAVTQVSQRHSEGRAYYGKKVTDGKTAKEALRALKRQVSDAIYKHLKAGAARAAAGSGPGGQPGNDSLPARPARTPNASSAKPLPDLSQPYDPRHTTLRRRPHPARRKRPAEPLDAKRSRYGRRSHRPQECLTRVPNWPFCFLRPRLTCGRHDRALGARAGLSGQAGADRGPGAADDVEVVVKDADEIGTGQDDC